MAWKPEPIEAIGLAMALAGVAGFSRLVAVLLTQRTSSRYGRSLSRGVCAAFAVASFAGMGACVLIETWPDFPFRVVGLAAFIPCTVDVLAATGPMEALRIVAAIGSQALEATRSSLDHQREALKRIEEMKRHRD